MNQNNLVWGESLQKYNIYIYMGWMRIDETHLSVFHSVSDCARGRCSRSSIVRARDWATFTLHDLADLYVESVTAHHIKRNDHSCFQNRWPKLKTELKLKHLWEQGGPLVFRGPMQRAYSAYREDRLCINVTLDHKTSLKSLLYFKSLFIFVAIAKNTLYGSKLLIFLLCQKSLGYIQYIYGI